MSNRGIPEGIIGLARSIRLLVLDVDGVLTDGKLYLTNSGDEGKAFHTMDGLGLKLLQQTGVIVALITGRDSQVVSDRAAALGIDIVHQGRDDKIAVLDEILGRLAMSYEHVAYCGDDLPDLACVKKARLGIAVPNGHFLVAEAADVVTTRQGGQGAVREICDWILQAQANFDTATAPFQ